MTVGHPSQTALLDSVHELDVLLQLPAHHGQQLFILLLELHLRHAAIKELGDKHAGSGRQKARKTEGGRVDVQTQSGGSGRERLDEERRDNESEAFHLTR